MTGTYWLDHLQTVASYLETLPSLTLCFVWIFYLLTLLSIFFLTPLAAWCLNNLPSVVSSPVMTPMGSPCPRHSRLNMISSLLCLLTYASHMLKIYHHLPDAVWPGQDAVKSLSSGLWMPSEYFWDISMHRCWFKSAATPDSLLFLHFDNWQVVTLMMELRSYLCRILPWCLQPTFWPDKGIWTLTLLLWQDKANDGQRVAQGRVGIVLWTYPSRQASNSLRVLLPNSDHMHYLGIGVCVCVCVARLVSFICCLLNFMLWYDMIWSNGGKSQQFCQMHSLSRHDSRKSHETLLWGCPVPTRWLLFRLWLFYEL